VTHLGSDAYDLALLARRAVSDGDYDLGAFILGLMSLYLRIIPYCARIN